MRRPVPARCAPTPARSLSNTFATRISPPDVGIDRFARGQERAFGPNDPVARFPRAGDRQAAVEGRLPRGFGLKRLVDLPMAWPDRWRTLELQAPAQAQGNDPPLLVCLPARGGDPSIRTGSSVAVRSLHIRNRARWTRSISNLGNGNLRPETFGKTRQELPRESPDHPLRPVIGAVSYGNVVLFCDGGNHARTRGLLGGGRSRAKLVSLGRFPCLQGKNRELHQIL